MKRFLCAYFNTLTGIDVNTRLIDSLSREGKKVLHFFESQLPRWKKDVRTVLKDIDSAGGGDIDYGVASMLTTVAYFREREDSLFLLADVSINGSFRVKSNKVVAAPSQILFKLCPYHEWVPTPRPVKYFCSIPMFS